MYSYMCLLHDLVNAPPTSPSSTGPAKSSIAKSRFPLWDRPLKSPKSFPPHRTTVLGSRYGTDRRYLACQLVPIIPLRATGPSQSGVVVGVFCSTGTTKSLGYHNWKPSLSDVSGSKRARDRHGHGHGQTDTGRTQILGTSTQ